MSNVFGTNLMTVSAAQITVGQQATGSDANDNSVHMTTSTNPLTHGVYMVVDSGNFYVCIDDGTATFDDDSNFQTLGVKVSANNPLFMPIKDPSKICYSATASSKTMTFTFY